MVLRGLVLVVLAVGVAAQSNYANHGNSIEYSGSGLPEQATLDGKVTKLDDLSPVIFLNRTKAALNCAAGAMEAELKFEEPFYGIAFADFNRNSPCFVSGNGNLTYKIEMPLKGCGSVQNPQRVFTNNIVVRFHPNLEMDGDEVITIVCRYPPPIAPPPPAPPIARIQSAPGPIVSEPPLKGFQVMLIVCAIFFLSLVLLGLAASYYCLSRRRVAVIRRVPMALSLAGSDITKMSESSISMFEGLKIPRATVTPIVVVGSSISGSEAALIIDDQSDTLPSDYPSESPSSAHSEMEAITVRQAASEVSSIYDASACADESLVVHQDSRVPPPPQFDVSVRVKRAAPSPPPRASSISCSSRGSTPPPPMPVMPLPAAVADVSTAEALRIQERNLTTILEREDLAEAAPTMRASAHLTVQPPIQPTVTITTRPPVYSRILRRQKSDESEVRLQRRDSLNTLNTENTDTHSVNEVVDEGLATIELEPPVVAVHKPEITQHVVDDVFLRTITEKRIIEDIERRTREVTEFHARVPPPPPPVTFDVAIRSYPDPNAVPDWDRYSTASSSTMISEPKESYRSSMNIPMPAEPIANWDVLIRVLEVPEAEPNLLSPALVSKANEINVDDDRSSVCSATSILTNADREKWRQIITTESTLRTLLTEATVREDYERIRHDQRYEQLFEPQKWDVIIRVLAPPEDEQRVRFRKASASSRSDWDNRSRRSSLPTLYEFDSDAASVHTGGAERVSVKSHKSSYRSDAHDMRSMSEFTCNDFAARPEDHAYSDASGPAEYQYDDQAGSLMRSASQPSLARSASEFTERRWAVESNMMASSPEQTPVLARRAKSSELLLSTSSSYVASSSVHHQYQERWGADSESSYK
ncbi:uncharacterized protein LOC132201856 [Neocloeon triangulifer]|uniref:uncharacterized protein LOC132201856 n=1 Tax=Neocloeon triangulifer TaxID=2078957 RepID=UPI00286F3167|nr:uncharacterized protein LOC132201856 [Neocloeon triangulifer]